ncbi:MAG: cytidylate kinase-like family protein [Bacteroidales bacterium]|jgi:cytidylate kinase|nr:cytidylate kinase-like family protein [Bacteroidales bacterium]
MNETYIITIGRQLGSGGKEIGNRLSKILNIPCYDKELLHLASKESGVQSTFFEDADEKNSFSVLDALSSFWEGDFFTNNYLSNESLFQIQSDVIQKLAHKQSCIFVGRCADYVLRSHPRLLSVFITAATEDRVATMAHAEHISKEKAQTLIEQTDKKRAAYYDYFSNKVWGAAKSYDLCINTSTFGIEQSVNTIVNLVREQFSLS